MVVWGGRGPNFSFVDSGGRYSPAENAWVFLSPEGDPPSLVNSTAVWTGDHVIVWGGGGGNAIGGRYVVAVPHDADGDGFADCQGDCDDVDASINPGAVEICNGLDDDCDIEIDEDTDALCDDGAFCTTDFCGGTVGCLSNPLPAGEVCPEGAPAGECLMPATCDGDGACRNAFVAAGMPCGDSADTSCTNPDSCDGAGTCAAYDVPDGTVCQLGGDRDRRDDDDDGGHGDDDDHGGHGDDDDDGGHGDDDDGRPVCIAGACVRLGGGDGEGDENGDDVPDNGFDSLRVTLVQGEYLLLRWETPSVTPGTHIAGYRVWGREKSGGSWRVLAQVTSTSYMVPIGAAAGDHFFQVTAITE
jgi:hypothetical protein